MEEGVRVALLKLVTDGSRPMGEMSDSWRGRQNVTQVHAFKRDRSEENIQIVSHLAVADAVHHLAVFAVEGVRQQAQTLQHNIRQFQEAQKSPACVWPCGVSPHLGGELLLAVHQALDVRRVVAAALTRRDGAFASGAGDLRGDGGGGGQGPRAHAGGQRVAQGLGDGSRSHRRRLYQLLPQQEEVTGLLHLRGGTSRVSFIFTSSGVI